MELRVISPEPHGEDVMYVLELAMEMAREGSLSSICIAGITRDGGPYWNWSEVPNSSSLIGAIERMKFDLIRETDDA